jgi:hypothetical protein
MAGFQSQEFLNNVKIFETELQKEFDEWKDTGNNQKDFTPTYLLLKDLKTYMRDNDFILHVSYIILIL